MNNKSTGLVLKTDGDSLSKDHCESQCKRAKYIHAQPKRSKY